MIGQDFVFKCHRCNRWFKQGIWACAVMHYGNGCCHYGDTETNPPTPRVVNTWKGTETILRDGKIETIAAPNPNAINVRKPS